MKRKHKTTGILKKTSKQKIVTSTSIEGMRFKSRFDKDFEYLMRAEKDQVIEKTIKVKK